MVSRTHALRGGYTFAERGDSGEGRGGMYCAYWVLVVKGQEGASIVTGVFEQIIGTFGVGFVVMVVEVLCPRRDEGEAERNKLRRDVAQLGNLVMSASRTTTFVFEVLYALYSSSFTLEVDEWNKFQIQHGSNMDHNLCFQV